MRRSFSKFYDSATLAAPEPSIILAVLFTLTNHCFLSLYRNSLAR